MWPKWYRLLTQTPLYVLNLFHMPRGVWIFLFLPLWGWNTHWWNSIPNGHSQWAFGMILLPYLVKIAIYGTMHHVRCLATLPRNASYVLRHAHYMWSFPDYLLFIYLWDVGTCVLEYDISYTRVQNFHHGTRQRLVPRWKFCPLV